MHPPAPKPTDGQYPEVHPVSCPKCDSPRIAKLRETNPASRSQWFQCSACGHLWNQRREGV